MQQTDQYKLNLIESGDTFSATPLNENAEKVEAALAEQASEVATLQSGLLKCAVGTYTGNGKYGSSNPTTIKVDFKPLFVMVWAPQELFRIVGIQGQDMRRYYTDSNATINAVWGENSVDYYSTSAGGQMNMSNCIYHYIVLGV